MRRVLKRWKGKQGIRNPLCEMLKESNLTSRVKPFGLGFALGWGHRRHHQEEGCTSVLCYCCRRRGNGGRLLSCSTLLVGAVVSCSPSRPLVGGRRNDPACLYIPAVYCFGCKVRRGKGTSACCCGSVFPASAVLETPPKNALVLWAFSGVCVCVCV